jgi:putative transposase
VGAYKHYRNPKDPGVPLFATTTVLDFVHAFHRMEAREAMVFTIARECKILRATLYGYVVMPHHIHLLFRPQAKMNGPQFMRILKKRSGEAITQLLTEGELRQFDQQKGLNGNTFWKYSFRSVVIDSREMFWEKMNYIHQNPVKAGYVLQSEDYRWSSARLVLEGKLSTEHGLAYDEVVKSLGAWTVEGDSDPSARPEA